jgi:phospholipase C
LHLGLAAALGATLASCGGHAATAPAVPLGSTASNASGSRGSLVPDASEKGKIKHIVIIVQENRSFDNIFKGLKGANYATQGLDSNGKVHKLTPISFASSDPDLCHDTADARADVDGGKMDGWLACTRGNKLDAYTYVKSSETKLYFDMAKQYVVGDDFFSSQLDGSYVAHQYLIAAQAGMAINTPSSIPWGCDAPTGTTVQLVDSNGNPTQKVFPCFSYNTLAKELDTQHDTWKDYSPGSSDVSGYLWSAYNAVQYIRQGADWSTNVISPQCQVLADAAAGNLPTVTWVTPNLPDSDHPSSLSKTGPNWVAAVVNAIGQSSLWSSTAIFITWDDWGGFYDHVPPPTIANDPAADWFGPGIRAPLIAISPYAKQGTVTHTQYEFADILRSTESLLGLRAMTVRDKDAAGFWKDTTMFDFTQSPRAFTPFSNSGYTCSAQHSGPPDNDYGVPMGH